MRETETNVTIDDAPARPPFGSRRNELLVVAALAVLALTLRLVHVFAMRTGPYLDAPIMDAAYHLEWARAFAKGDEFYSGPFFRAPLYPWVLGITQLLFGENLLAPRIVQSLFGTATTVLCYFIGKRAFGTRDHGHWIGAIAAFGAATYWVLIHFDAELLIPTLIVPLDLLALYLTLGLAQRASRGLAIAAGLVWGVSAIARPNVLLFMPLVAIWLLVRARPAWRKGIATAALFSLGLLMPILPITAYNVTVGGDPVLISSQAGIIFWIGNNPKSDGSTAIVPGTRFGWWEGYHDTNAQAEAAEGRKLRPSEISRHYAQRAWRWIVDNPGDAATLLFKKIRVYFSSWEVGNNMEVRFFAFRYDPLLPWLPLRFPLLIGLGVLGLGLALRRASVMFPLWGFVVVYSVSVVAFFVCSRYRLPVLPVMMVFGAHALVWLAQAMRERRFRSLGIGLVVALVAGLSTLHVPSGVRTADDNGYLQLGNAESLRGNHEVAIGHYETALRIDPANYVASVGLARSLLARGEQSRAERVLRAAQQIVPFVPEVIDALLNVLVEPSRLPEAERVAAAAYAHDPGMPLLAFQRGRIRLLQGRMPEAAELFQRAADLDPRNFAIRFSLARALELAKRPEAAIRSYERALELIDQADAQFAAATFDGLIRLLQAAGRGAEAQRYREQFGTHQAQRQKRAK